MPHQGPGNLLRAGFVDGHVRAAEFHVLLDHLLEDRGLAR